MSDASEPDPKKMQDRALVTLALGVTEEQTTTGVSASDEDLILFYQDQLGDELRAQVMRTIANDDNTYQRWIDIVQTNELANELAQEVNEVVRESVLEKPGSDASKNIDRSVEIKKWNLLDEIRSWVRKDGAWTSTFGMACTIALVAGLAVFLVPQMIQNPTLDELYDQYALTGSALLPEKSINLSSELAKGIVSGFKELAADNLPSEWQIDPTRYSDTEINPDRGEESPYALGRLVALSLIQCKSAKNGEYFKLAAPLLRKLLNQNDSFAKYIVDSGSDRDDVCDSSGAIIKLV